MYFFGTTIAETIKAFSSKNEENIDNWGAKKKPGQKAKRIKDLMMTITRIIISLCILGLGCYLLYNDNESEQGYGIIGLVIGYWLK